MLLPALPFSLWSRDFLEGLANTIDSFVGVEDDFQLLFDKQMARVLVELDITRGLPADIDIVCGELLICQKQEYLHVLF